MSSSGHEAQRELEQKALRNVRSLVDKMENTDEVDQRAQNRLMVAILGGALVVVIVIAVVLLIFRGSPQPVAIDPAKLPPVQAGPKK